MADGLVQGAARRRRMAERRLREGQGGVAEPATARVGELRLVPRALELTAKVEGIGKIFVVPGRDDEAAVDRLSKEPTTLVPAASSREPPAELRQAFRVVRVQRDRPPLHALGLLKIA
ncbi:MAG TPA: hypothetical protein VFY87_02730, partial [Geminicoccaceae bacterium]|nr:hypothetical protein [Geminicoccaceae bacterium]